jgi:hypothetical protein
MYCHHQARAFEAWAAWRRVPYGQFLDIKDLRQQVCSVLGLGKHIICKSGSRALCTAAGCIAVRGYAEGTQRRKLRWQEQCGVNVLSSDVRSEWHCSTSQSDLLPTSNHLSMLIVFLTNK